MILRQKSLVLLIKKYFIDFFCFGFFITKMSHIKLILKSEKDNHVIRYKC